MSTDDPLPEVITEAQWERILGDRKRSLRVLVKPEQIEWAGKRAVSCGNCANTHMHGDPRRGWCVAQRCMVSLAFTVLCREYTTEDGKKPYAAAQAPDAVEVGNGRDQAKAPPAPATTPVAAALSEKSHGVRDTSISAYRALEYSGRLTRQQRKIMDFLEANPQRDYTRQELGNAVGFGINVICGRVNELLSEPFALVEEVGRRECRITGETANALRARASRMMKEAA